MRQLNTRMVFVCLAALLFVVACADNQQKTAEATIEEVTLNRNDVKHDCTSKVQEALKEVTGVSEVVSVSMAENKAVVKIEKGKVETDTLVKAVTDAGANFSASLAE